MINRAVDHPLRQHGQHHGGAKPSHRLAEDSFGMQSDAAIGLGMLDNDRDGSILAGLIVKQATPKWVVNQV